MAARGSGAVHVTLAQALAKGPPPRGNLAVPIFDHDALNVEMYQPPEVDRQRAHDRDEVYLVARGRAMFFDGHTRYEVQPGAFLFVPAGQRHAFDEFTPNFAVWVFFFGPRSRRGRTQRMSASTPSRRRAG